MKTYKRAKVLAVVMTVTLLGAACGDDDDDDAATATAPEDATTVEEETTTTGGEAEAEAVTIVADDYEFSDAPTELAAGVVELTFENAGQVEHELALVEIGDTPIDEVGDALAPVLEGGPFPDFLENLTIPLTAEGGSSLTTSALLAEGDYALICTLTGVAPAEGATTTSAVEGEGGEEGEEGPPHFELGMVQPLTVTAGDASATLSEADSTITASDYAFEVDVSAGEQTVAFVNDGPDEVHHAVFFPFAEGVDAAAGETALAAFLSSEEEGPPPPEFDFEAQTFSDFGVFSTGLGATYEASFESGRTYAVVCFIQDRSGGPPHAIAHNMTEVFTVE